MNDYQIAINGGEIKTKLNQNLMFLEFLLEFILHENSSWRVENKRRQKYGNLCTTEHFYERNVKKFNQKMLRKSDAATKIVKMRTFSPSSPFAGRDPTHSAAIIALFTPE